MNVGVVFENQAVGGYILLFITKILSQIRKKIKH